MTENKRTPGEWVVTKDYYVQAYVPEWQDEREPGMHTIAKACGGSHEMRKANAAFIVRACNAHDELLAALESIVAEYDGVLPPYSGVITDTVIEIARKRIAKARGEK